MRSLLAILIFALAGFVSSARADVARVADLAADETLVIEKLFIGTVPQTTRFTFARDKVVVEDFGKKVGEVKLSAAEKASVDQFLDLVRQGKRATGNGSSTYTVSFFRDGRERRGFRERIQIAFPKEADAKVLTLDELKRRAGK